MTQRVITRNKLTDFDINDLDAFERMQFTDLTSKGLTKENALQVLINSVEGDYSQLSDELGEIAMEQDETNF
jgi:hypothetical protein